MLVEIKLEKLLNNIPEAKVIRLRKKVGDTVTTGETLFDLEANKVNIPVQSPCNGIIKSIAVKVGQTVKTGDVLAVLKQEKTATNDAAKDESSGVTKSPSGTGIEGGLGYFGTLLKPQKQQLECDMAILGGGPGGYVAAIQGAKMGAQVVLVEKDTLGGTCLNRGCIPTKALVHSAELYHHLQGAEHYGCNAESITVDFKKVMARKDTIVQQLRQGIAYLLERHGVTLVNGTGEIRDEKTLWVKDNTRETTINAHHIIIATGSVPTQLPIPGANLAHVLTTEQVLQLSELPRSIAIIGGGVIGMEYAFIFANFGVPVAIIELFNDCLAGLDQDICEEITRIAQSRGIKIYTGAKVQEIALAEDSQCLVFFTQADQRKYLLAHKVLLSVGRKPFFSGVNVAELNLQLNESQRGIRVNRQMQTNIPHIYAIGDVTDTVMLAHVASHQGMVAAKNIMGQNCTMDYHAVPSAIFTDPEIAVVGISEKEAQKEGLSIKVSNIPFTINGRALTTGESRGFVKIIQDQTEKIIGAAIMGPRASDLIAQLTLAVQNGLTARQITETIHAHPTNAEVIWEAALALGDGAIHFWDE